MQIDLENLKKDYNGFKAVDGISLHITENCIYGIIGKSGAGKSTLVRMISLLESPDEGKIFYDSKRMDNLNKKSLILARRQFGMIFQNFNLFSSRNVSENIAYPMEINGYSKKEIKEKVKKLLETVDLADKGNSPISKLSGGQKQRVAIARALACDPKVLFCDEATSALDPQTTRSILSLLKNIQKKMNLTVVLITHQMEVVRDSCDFVSVLDEGKIVEQGLVKDIFSNPKHPVTNDFLSHLTNDNIKKPGYVLRFRGSLTDTPVISKLTREIGVEINIRSGGVQEVAGEEIGKILCDISGDESQKKQAIDYLIKHGIVVEKEVFDE